MPHNLLDRISIDPLVCFGKPCIRGTRIWVSLIMKNLAAGVSAEELLKAYPALEPEDILAALSYGAALSRERYIPFESEAANKVQA